MHSAFAWFFLSMKGRIGRQEFALGLFGLVLIDMLVARVGLRLADSGPVYYTVRPPPLDWSATRLLIAVSLWAFAAILVKRLHDFNLSGWWALAILAIPHLTKALAVPGWIPYLLFAATLGAIPGQQGDNRFGSDPLPRAGV